jgi:hypothetical protein
MKHHNNDETCFLSRQQLMYFTFSFKENVGENANEKIRNEIYSE